MAPTLQITTQTVNDPEFLSGLIIASFAMPILLALILVWFVVSYQKRKHEFEVQHREQKLREQSLIISKQQALQAERKRIASEMHDDLGGGLTSIKFLSQKILKKIDDPVTHEQVARILDQSEILVSSMSEIIWAMNAGFDSLSSLIAYSQRFALEYLEGYAVEVNFSVFGETESYVITGEKRRNIFLVIKEAIHNVLKHSSADSLDIAFSALPHVLEISIRDNGKHVVLPTTGLGNGLKNMRHRIESMQGNISFNTDNGLTISLQIPHQATALKPS